MMLSVMFAKFNIHHLFVHLRYADCFVVVGHAETLSL